MISVITPVHNGERFIEACIQAVIDQICPEAEHVIADGGSTDGTVEVIRRYASRYPHIRWVSKKDAGQSDAMNRGIALARGEIVGFLNVDDYYEPGALNRIAAVFRSLPVPSLAVGNCNVWGDGGELLWVNTPRCLKVVPLLSGTASFPENPSAYFYHASLHRVIGPYDVHDHYTMDLDFILKAVQACSVEYFDEVWGNFRLIRGTKTYADRENDRADSRFRRLVNIHTKKLKARERFQLRLIRLRAQVAYARGKYLSSVRDRSPV